MNGGTELTDEERERYETLIEETPTKDLLLEIMMEVKTCRYYLEQLSGVEDDMGAETPQEPRYACRTCGKEVRESDRRDHLTDAHNAPSAIPLADEYESI